MTNRLTSTLKNYFPHVLQWFQDKDTNLFCDFLSRWPTLKAAQLARRTTLETFFRAHHGRSADVIAQRLQAIKSATPLTTDEGVITPNALLVQALVAQLRVTLQAIADFDTAIAQRAPSLPTSPSSKPSQVLGQSLLPASSSPLANNGNALPPLLHCHHMPGLPRSPNAAGRSLGCIGACSVRSSSVKHLWSGRQSRSDIPSRRSSTPSSNGTKGKPIRQPYGP